MAKQTVAKKVVKTRKTVKLPAVIRQTHASVLTFGKELSLARTDIHHMADAITSLLSRDKKLRQAIIELLKQVGEPSESARGFLDALGMLGQEPLERAPRIPAGMGS